MTAAALLHPDISTGAILPFQQVSSGLRIISDLKDASGLDAALIFGGDGTIHRYLAELHRHKIPALVVPVVSGNDFARALGIESVNTALRAWTRFCQCRDNVREIDLGVISSGEQEILFCCVASAGLDTETNARANLMPAWLRKRGGYIVAALWSLAVGHAFQISVQAPEFQRDGLAWLVASGNADRYGGGLKIVPQASLDDGLLDICLVDKMSKIKLLCALPTLFWGGHTGLKEVRYFRTKQMRLEARPELEIYADGEPAGYTPVEFTVLSQAFKVILPV